MPMICLSLDHKRVGIGVREHLHIAEEESAQVLATLREEASLTECVLLSTCNRTELYFIGQAGDGTCADVAARILCRLAGIVLPSPGPLVRLQGEDAVRHLFRVAAGLESAVPGEHQILGQVKAAYRIACGVGANGFFTNAVFHRAFRVGKRVRSQTTFGAGSRSTGSSAVQMAARELGDLPDRRALVIGAGETSQMVLRALKRRNVRHITLVNRTIERARLIAEQYGARAVPIVALEEEVLEHELVFSATACPTCVLTRGMLKHGVRGRLWVYDLALPRDVDPALAEIPEVHLRNLDDLKHYVAEACGQRRHDVPQAEAIVEDAVSEYMRWLRELGALPSIRRLFEIGERVRLAEIQRVVDEQLCEDMRGVDRFSQRIVQKLMNVIVEELKSTARTTSTLRDAGEYLRILQ